MASTTYAPRQVSNIMALTAILMWLKLLRYLQLSARLSQLTQTIARAAIDMANFRPLTLIRTRTRTLTRTLTLTLTVTRPTSY